MGAVGLVLGVQRPERLARGPRAAPGWPARSRRRRPRRSGTRPGGRRRPTGSAPASPRCRRRATARSRGRCRPGARSRRRATAARTAASSSPGANPGEWTVTTRRPSARVALVPRLDVGERAQRARAAEVPELDQHRAPALLVHPQRRDVDPRELRREGRGGDVVDRRAHGAATLADRNDASMPAATLASYVGLHPRDSLDPSMQEELRNAQAHACRGGHDGLVAVLAVVGVASAVDATAGHRREDHQQQGRHQGASRSPSASSTC